MEESYLYQQIAESIRRQIIEGKLKSGDRLPSIRSLIDQWNCTPGTIQRAYNILARQGLVLSRPGKGTHVLDPMMAPSDAHIRKASLVNRAETFLLEVLTAGYTIEDVKQAVSMAIDHWNTISVLDEHEPGNEICFSGSHDLALKWVLDHAETIFPGYIVKTEISGSLGGLLSLAQGTADIAGTHLWDPETDTYNETFIRKIFPGKKMAAVTLAHRWSGFLVMPGNPKNILSFHDLTKPDVHFINRQSGSGTRVWLDIQLHKAGIAESAITGYQNEKSTHSEIAQAIISGQADVGLGLKAISQVYSLDFIPLTQERYDLVLFAHNLEQEPYSLLQKSLELPQIRSSLEKLGGYVCEESGHVRFIE